MSCFKGPIYVCNLLCNYRELQRNINELNIILYLKIRSIFLTAQDALFEWTKVSLLSGINAGRTCPECAKSWGMSELMEKGNMSLDEKIFFEQVFMINYRRTPTQLEKHDWLNHGVKTVKGSKFTQKSSVDPIQNIDLSPADH